MDDDFNEYNDWDASGSDLDRWEENQVFLDHQHEDHDVEYEDAEYDDGDDDSSDPPFVSGEDFLD